MYGFRYSTYKKFDVISMRDEWMRILEAGDSTASTVTRRFLCGQDNLNVDPDSE